MTISAWLRWDAIRRFLPTGPARVLDIGAGTGTIGALLARRYTYMGVEPDPVSFAAAQRRVGPAGHVLNCGFEALEEDHAFDLVCAFEVLEHMSDDLAALRRWVWFLRPGGTLLVSVPKGTGRYGPANQNVGDLRRYEPEALAALLSRAGLARVVTRSYGTPYGNVQEAIQNRVLRARLPRDASMETRTAASARSMQPPERLGAAVRFLAAPLQVAQRPFSAFGIGTGVVARGDLIT